MVKPVLVRVIAALLLFGAALLVQRGTVQAQEGCASPLEPGHYLAFFTQVIVATSAGAGGVVVETINDGRADLEIACDGTITGTFKGSPVNTVAPQLVMSTFHAAIIALEEEAKCTLYGEYKLTSGKVLAGAGGAPRIVLNFTAGNEQSQCSGSDALLELVKGLAKSSGGTTAHTWTWQAEEWDPTFAHGQQPFGDPQQEATLANMAQSSTVTQQQQWLIEKTEQEPTPLVTNLDRQYDYVFLEHIPNVLNRYSATIDWQEQEPGTVSFAIDGQPLTSESAGNTASTQVQIDALAAGQHLLSVVATSAKGKSSPPYQQPITIVPVPAWAEPYGLTAKPQDSYVLYESTKSVDLPPEPLDFTVNVPKLVPYLSGAWGLKNVQVQTNLSASSYTGPSNALVTGNGAVALAGKDLALTVPAAASFMRTNLQAAGLQLEAGQATFELPLVEYSRKLGLQDIFPGVSVLYQQPKIGAALQSLDLSLFSATIRNRLHGTGTLGVADNKVKFVGGTATDEVDMFVTAGPNFADTVFALVVAGATASLTVDLALPPHATDCQLNGYAYFLYGAFGHIGTYPDPVSPLNILSCADFAAGGSGHQLAVPALAANAPLKVQPRSAQWQQEHSVEQPVATANRDGSSMVALVENASALWSAPRLAAGSDGRLALAWVSEIPQRQRPQAWQTRLRIFDGKNWGGPIALSDDTLPDYTPTVAFDASGGMIVAWVQSSAGDEGRDGALDGDLLAKTEIAYATVDAAGSVKSGVLTNDSALDFNPQLAAGTDGAVWLAWESSPAGNFLGSASMPNALLVARWDGRGWSPVERATDELDGVTSWHLAARDAQSALVVEAVRRDSGSEVIVLEHAGDTWLAPRSLTTGLPGGVNPRAAYSVDGKPIAAWSSEDGIAGVLGDLAVAPVTWLTTTDRLDAILVGGAGDLALVLSGVEGSKSMVSIAQYDPDMRRWSERPASYYGQPGSASPSAVVGADGEAAFVLAEWLARTEQLAQPAGEVLAEPQLPELATVRLVRAPSMVVGRVQSLPRAATQQPLDFAALGAGAAGVAILLVAITLVMRRQKRVN